jgi:hypothetical protein
MDVKPLTTLHDFPRSVRFHGARASSKESIVLIKTMKLVITVPNVGFGWASHTPEQIHVMRTGSITSNHKEQLKDMV